MTSTTFECGSTLVRLPPVVNSWREVAPLERGANACYLEGVARRATRGCVVEKPCTGKESTIEYVTGLNGETARERRFVFLGYSSELPNKRAAERKLGEMLAGINSLDYKPRSIVTLQEFFDSVYAETVLKHKKPSTRRDIQNGLRKHILPKFGSRQMTQISKLD